MRRKISQSQTKITNFFSPRVIGKGLGGNTSCEICEEENENLEHFLLWCPEYQRERSENKKLQRPFEEDTEKIIGELLFEENTEKSKETIYNMWKKREKKLKEIHE